MWRSLVAHLHGVQGVAGSNPVTPTIYLTLPSCECRLLLKYAVVIEESTNGYSAYLPDLPGCIAAGDTLEGTEDLVQESVSHHLELLLENGDPIPEPQTTTALEEA